MQDNINKTVEAGGFLWFSDLHGSERTLEKCKMSLNAVIDCIDDSDHRNSNEPIDFTLFTGDWWDGRQFVTHRSAFTPLLDQAYDLAIRRMLVMIPGTSTHDIEGSLEEFKRIPGCHVLEKPEPFLLTSEMCNNRPSISLSGNDYLILPIPALTKSHLLKEHPDLSGDEANEQIKLLLNGLMAGYKIAAHDFRQEHPAGKVIVAGHVSTIGASISNDQMIPATDICIAPDSLMSVGADIVCLGHIHRRQVIQNTKVVYCGNPFQHTFGEADDVNKGFNHVKFFEDANEESLAGINDIMVYDPAYRHGFSVKLHTIPDIKPMVDIKTKLVPVTNCEDVNAPKWFVMLVDEDGQPTDPDQEDTIYSSCHGADVRYRIEVPEEYKDEVDEERVLNNMAGHEVVPASLKFEKKVISHDRERCPEAAELTSNADLFKAWGKATETEVDSDDLDALAELERKVANGIG
jgi:DNA repair exonuclease SbcCD nuclease subunit